MNVLWPDVDRRTLVRGDRDLRRAQPALRQGLTRRLLDPRGRWRQNQPAIRPTRATRDPAIITTRTARWRESITGHDRNASHATNSPMTGSARAPRRPAARPARRASAPPSPRGSGTAAAATSRTTKPRERSATAIRSAGLAATAGAAVPGVGSAAGSAAWSEAGSVRRERACVEPGWSAPRSACACSSPSPQPNGRRPDSAALRRLRPTARVGTERSGQNGRHVGDLAVPVRRGRRWRRPQEELGRCLEGLGACVGFVDGAVGRALDDPGLWVLETRWDVGRGVSARAVVVRDQDDGRPAAVAGGRRAVGVRGHRGGGSHQTE